MPIIIVIFVLIFSVSEVFAAGGIVRPRGLTRKASNTMSRAVSARAGSNCSIRRNPLSAGYSIYNVMSVDEEGRQTEEEFATSERTAPHLVKRRFAATGKLKCRNHELTAQLTGANDVITTSGHALFDQETCEERSKPEECEFSTEVNGQRVSRKVTRSVGVGFQCPGTQDLHKDWAVMKLESGIDVEPYALPDEDYLLDPGEDVISVAAGASDLIQAKWRNSKAIDKCVTKKVHMTFPAYFETNCDSAGGSSGGSVLKRMNNRDVLIGIAQGNTSTDEQESQGTRGNRFRCNYQEGTCATGHVKLEAEFLEAVKQAIGPQSI